MRQSGPRWRLCPNPLTVGILTTGITVAMLTIGVLDPPFGTNFRVQPQPFELLLDEIEGNRGR
jgi:hypothetical protein